MAEISGGLKVFVLPVDLHLDVGIAVGGFDDLVGHVLLRLRRLRRYLRPMNRLIEKTVFCGLVTAWRLAAWPTSRSPVLVKATTDGVVRAPSEFSRTTGSPPSMTAMQEFVVPRSMPRIFAMGMKILS